MNNRRRDRLADRMDTFGFGVRVESHRDNFVGTWTTADDIITTVNCWQHCRPPLRSNIYHRWNLSQIAIAVGNHSANQPRNDSPENDDDDGQVHR